MDKKSMNKKWYIVESSGEGTSYAIVNLTKEEHNAFVKTLKNMETVVDGDYAAETCIFRKGFATREDAISFIKELYHKDMEERNHLPKTQFFNSKCSVKNVYDL